MPPMQPILPSRRCLIGRKSRSSSSSSSSSARRRSARRFFALLGALLMLFGVVYHAVQLAQQAHGTALRLIRLGVGVFLLAVSGVRFRVFRACAAVLLRPFGRGLARLLLRGICVPQSAVPVQAHRAGHSRPPAPGLPAAQCRRLHCGRPHPRRNRSRKRRIFRLVCQNRSAFRVSPK